MPPTNAARLASGLAGPNSGLVSENTVPLFSRVAFVAVRTGAGPFTHTIASGDRKAFGYAQGQMMDIAGDAGVASTPADTNILKPGETPNNETVKIRGISIKPVEATSDPELVAAIMSKAYIDLALGSNVLTPLGRIENAPSCYGLYGRGFSTIREGALGSPVGLDIEFLRNGNPIPGQMLRLPDLEWAANGSGEGDSTCNVIFRLPQQVILTATNRTAAAGIAAFTTPTVGLRADFMVFLHTYRTAKRSRNI